jgi:hypothetical protein
MMGFVTAVLYAFLGFSIVAPVVLMLIADLRVKSEESGVEAAPVAPHGHGSGHH